LLISTYELGHQPLELATAAAALLAAGHEVRCADLALDPLDPADVAWCDRAALSVPMFTAMRLAVEAATSLRALRPELPLCVYGLYAASGHGSLRELTTIAGEYEAGLVSWAGGGDPGPPVQLGRGRREPSPLPARRLLAPLERYARVEIGGEERLMAAVQAGRGCSHRCRHCPVPVVYDGRVRRVDEAVVLADIDQVVEAGARHVSFADPDFFNTPARSMQIVAELHRRHPSLTFDVTTKVEHVLAHRDRLAELRAAGCAFVVSAFESASDPILAVLDKGHTVADASAAVRLLRRAGLEVRPSWLPFTPWTDRGDLVDLLDFVIAHDLVANVDPVQYSVRLLVPDGSLLLGRPELAPHLGAYDPAQLGWPWAHPDPAIDALQRDVAALVETHVERPATETFAALDDLVRASGPPDRPGPAPGSVSRGPAGPRPRITEPWFCCSEPTAAQLAPLYSGPAA
jgi:hypothetical protein